MQATNALPAEIPSSKVMSIYSRYSDEKEALSRTQYAMGTLSDVLWQRKPQIGYEGRAEPLFLGGLPACRLMDFWPGCSRPACGQPAGVHIVNESRRRSVPRLTAFTYTATARMGMGGITRPVHRPIMDSNGAPSPSPWVPVQLAEVDNARRLRTIRSDPTSLEPRRPAGRLD